MNRSSLCIQLLHILYGRKQFTTKQELAQMLETNPRNISEYIKELELAGYMIESTSGKHGGYRLKEEGIFPSLSLSNNEKDAIDEALLYLKAQKNFIYYTNFETAMNKLKAKLNHTHQNRETIYLSDARKPLSVSENDMADRISTAIKEKFVICFQYDSSNSRSAIKREVLPYEMIISDEGLYLLADDKTANKTHRFKYFKIIDDRMFDVNILNRHFIRNHDFKIQDHIGSNTLMKELHEVELIIKGVNARLVNEREIENLISKQFENGILHIKFMMEGSLRLKRFILSLGSDCKVIAPKSIKDQIKTELLKTLENYETEI